MKMKLNKNNNCDKINKITNNNLSDVLAIINQKNDALNESCSRLREAIVSKTREIFNNQNDFCSKTMQVLQDSRIQEKKKSQRKNITKNWKSQAISPRRTRASTARIRNNSMLSQNGFFNDLCNESIQFGVPVMCSTFNNHHCTIHESCNREVRDINNIHIHVTPSAALETPTKALSEPSPPKKPLITNIQPCSIIINKLEKAVISPKTTILQQEPMEITDTQGNVLHESQFDYPARDNFERVDYSMCVNTSLDPTNCIKSQGNKKTPDNNGISYVQEQGIVKNISNVHQEKSNTIPVPHTTIYCNTINFINSSSVMEVDKAEEDMSVMEIPKDVVDKNNPVDKNVNCSMRKSIDNCSLVEGTPPASSIVSKSQTILNNSKKNVKKRVGAQNKKTEKLDLEKTIILDNLVIPANSTRENKGTIIIQETSDDSDDENSEPNKPQVPPQTSNLLRRRKLFTQRNSPVSIAGSPGTPISSPCHPLLPKVVRRKRMKKKNLSNVREKSRRLSKTLTQLSINKMSSSSSLEDARLTQTVKTVKKKKRLIKSKKIVKKQPTRTSILNILHNVSNNEPNEEVGLQRARSSDVFMMQNKFLKRKKNNNARSIIIVSTGLSNRDKELVKNAVSTIAEAKMESVVTRKTTHVVTTGVRTINLLRGIIRGCWIVELEWVKKSMEAGRWLNPEKYEIDYFSKAVKENRRDKEIFGSAYVSELFTTCGLIYIEENSSPPRKVLKELIGTAGGSLTGDRRKAKVIVGPEDVKEVWVLDSITSGELQSINQYKR